MRAIRAGGARSGVGGLGAALLGMPLAACLQVSTGTDTGPGASSGAGTSAASAASAAGGTTGGTGCSTDPQSGVTLCTGTAACPGVTVDPNAFPICGFVLHAGGTLDLECLCSDSLCPIGVPRTCAQASQLLTTQTLLLVCQQASDGRCVQLTTPDAGSSGSGTCLQQCRSDCAGVPNCMQLCGC
jgi:hypothetical protein